MRDTDILSRRRRNKSLEQEEFKVDEKIEEEQDEEGGVKRGPL